MRPTLLALVFLLIKIWESSAQSTHITLLEIPFNGSFADQSAYKIVPQIFGNVTPALNRFGLKNMAAYFTGQATSYISLGAPGHLNTKGPFSVSIWYMGGSKSFGDLEILIDKFGYLVSLYDVNKPYAGGMWDQSLNDMDSTTWHHLVVVNRLDSSFLYRDNVLRSSMKGYQNTIKSEVIIGKGFRGAIDNILVYEGAISKEEITELYTGSGEVITDVFSEKLHSSMMVSPNPSEGIFKLNSIAEEVEILDQNGRLLLSLQNVVQINLDGFAQGIYYARINKNTLTKLVKI